MSHTDKDDPPLVRARTDRRIRGFHVFCAALDLPTSGPTWRPCDGTCDRDGRPGGCRFWHYGGLLLGGPTPEACHLLFYGPDRARVRDTLRAARRDYNTHGVTDIEPFPRPHRHRLRDDWW
jgi:hypothetical protein